MRSVVVAMPTNPPTAGPEPRRKVVLYARVSSKDQERDGFSIPAQRRLLREYAHEHQLAVLKEFIDVETAKEAGRHSFGEMLAFLRDNRACRVLLVEKTDRLYRNLKDWVHVDDLDLEVHFVKEGVVLSPDSRSTEKFMHGIKVLMAKNYIDNLSEEVKKGQREKAEGGGWPSFAPLGYVNVAGKDGKRTIEPDPERAPLILKTYEWYSTGEVSVKEVTTMARSAGLTFRKSRDPITTARVHHILRSRLYTGDFDWGGRVYHGSYQPLVSKDLWHKVQDVLDDRLRRRPKKRKHSFAFANLISCGHCGCSVVGDIKKGRYIYYRCSGYKGRCPEPYVREEVLAERFAGLLEGIALEPEVIDWITKALKESHQDEKRFHDEAISRLQAEYTTLQNRLDAMYVDKLDGRIENAFFERMSASWRGEMERIADATEEHRTANRSYLDEGIRLLELGGRAAEMFRVQGSEKRRELLRFVVARSTWAEGRLEAAFRPPFDLLLAEVQKVRTSGGGSIPGDSDPDPPVSLSNRPDARTSNSKSVPRGTAKPDFEIWRREWDSNPR
ncbi:MAG: recombinase family protein [Candidatus Dormibacteria bacterium]